MYVVVLNKETAPAGEVYVFDTVAGHRVTSEALVAFLDRANETSLSLPSNGRCPLLPDAEFLRGLRFVCSPDLVLTSRTLDGLVQITGRRDLLRRYAREFLFTGECGSGHRHPETAFKIDELHPKTEMIVLEAEDELEECV
jgi:hypothetical protein